jgi:hypothetical protein
MKTSMSASPRVEHIDWGQMTVAGLGTGKDFKLWPGGGREWDWRETGTRHVPGIQPEDVEELLAAGAETIILSRGMWRALRTQQATLDRLTDAGATVHILETRAAVEKYNELATAGEPVAGLFHSTC